MTFSADRRVPQGRAATQARSDAATRLLQPTAARPASQQAHTQLAQHHYVFLDADDTRTALLELDGQALDDWAAFQTSWQRLPQDGYMNDGGRYRFRRHGVFNVCSAPLSIQRGAPQPHYQSRAHNTLNGGVLRRFAPLEERVASSPVLLAAMRLALNTFGGLAGTTDWQVEVHQFRIILDATGAFPTPEGIHRDGVNYVFMMLINRHSVEGGLSTIHAPDGRTLASRTLLQPLDVAMVNDEHVRHGVTPLQPLSRTTPGFRDMLVITFKAR